MERNFLGIDVGGTNLRGKLISESGKVTAEASILSEAHLGISTLMDNLASIVGEFAEHRVSAVGIGIPGSVDRRTGLLVQAPNVAYVKNFPFTKELLRRTKKFTSVFIENDASCAALGEYRRGVAKNCSSMVMMTLGTGLGGGIILDGKLWTGEDGFAGEIGHMAVDPTGEICACGSRGCLETLVSQRAVIRSVRAQPKLARKMEEIEETQIPKRLARLAACGDKHAVNIWKNLGKNLGVGISILVNVLNVKTVVVGGGLSAAWDFFIDNTLEEVTTRTLRGPATGLEIKKSALGGDAGVIGAAYLAQDGLYGKL